jgi:hypothetical protein
LELFGEELSRGFRRNFFEEFVGSLNLSDNALGPEGGKPIAAGIKVTMCAIAVILAPFS